jgi:hypothetical protein
MANHLDVPCVVEIEQSPESLHAHAIPEGVALRPGDRVLVHNAPCHVDYGEVLRVECIATVMRAGPLTRVWTQLAGMFELHELFEVGFQPKEHA